MISSENNTSCRPPKTVERLPSASNMSDPSCEDSLTDAETRSTNSGDQSSSSNNYSRSESRMQKERQRFYLNEIHSLRRHIEKLEGDLTDTKRQLGDARAVQESTMTIIVSQNEEFNRTKALVNKLRTENEELTIKIEDDQDAFHQQLTALAEIKRRSEEYFTGNMTKRDKKIASLEQELKNQNKTVAFLVEKVKRLEDDNASCSSSKCDQSSHHSGQSSHYSSDNDDRSDLFRNSLMAYRNIDAGLVADFQQSISMRDVTQEQVSSRPRKFNRGPVTRPRAPHRQIVEDFDDRSTASNRSKGSHIFRIDEEDYDLEKSVDDMCLRSRATGKIRNEPGVISRVIVESDDESGDAEYIDKSAVFSRASC
mmetsp:Transcript_20036/g.24759  ORF Transcript_20036/g.24759 Transcript_20036/m.24759 type:complete len:368 (-) Transcript_20036:126-1229(-)